MSNNESHPLDDPLGLLNELAIKLAIRGQHDVAILIAEAVEDIQKWVISQPEPIEEKPAPKIDRLWKDEAGL